MMNIEEHYNMEYDECMGCGGEFHPEDLDRGTGLCEQCLHEWYEENDKC